MSAIGTKQILDANDQHRIRERGTLQADNFEAEEDGEINQTLRPESTMDARTTTNLLPP